MRTTYQKTGGDSGGGGGVGACVFLAKKPKSYMGFCGSVNRTTTNPGFIYFRFCQCNWAL